MPIEADVDSALDEFFRRFTPQLEGSRHTEDLEKTSYVRREMIKRLAEHVESGAYLDLISGNAIVPLGILYLKEKGIMPGDTNFYITDSDPKAEELAKKNCEALAIPEKRVQFHNVEFDPMGNWYFKLRGMDIDGITLVDGADFIPCPDLFFDAAERLFFGAAKNLPPNLIIAQTGTADYMMGSLAFNSYTSNKKSYDINGRNLDIVICHRENPRTR